MTIDEYLSKEEGRNAIKKLLTASFDRIVGLENSPKFTGVDQFYVRKDQGKIQGRAMALMANTGGQAVFVDFGLSSDLSTIEYISHNQVPEKAPVEVQPAAHVS